MKMQATDCKEIFSTPYLIKDLYPKYVKEKKRLYKKPSKKYG